MKKLGLIDSQWGENGHFPTETIGVERQDGLEHKAEGAELCGFRKEIFGWAGGLYGSGGDGWGDGAEGFCAGGMGKRGREADLFLFLEG